MKKEKEDKKVVKEENNKKIDDISSKKTKRFAKINTIIGIIILIILGLCLVLIFNYKEIFERPKFVLDSIYSVYPEEVKELYSNIVSASCSGDLHLDIELDAEKTDVANLNPNNLLDYLFSHLDKKELLNDELVMKTINDTTKELFYGDVKLDINNYKHIDYIFKVDNNKITMEENQCNSDITYVTYLFGYSFGEKELSMDVDVGYVKNNTLYDLSNQELGEYAEQDLVKLFELLNGSSYYRFNYVKVGSKFKLSSVEWKNRI